MIRRIILENYMSHARTVIEPAAGLTVLAGPNNCGKSAVISALLSLRGDGEQAGDFMVRHGQKLCSVTLETDDGHVLVWRRKGSTVSYVIDGVEVHRVGRGSSPDKLPGLLRMPRIEPANTDKKFDLHFGLQKEPIFLIDSESDAARFFSASNDAERLLQMQQLQKERVKGWRRDERAAKAEVARIDGKLAALSPLGTIDAALVGAEREHEALMRDAQRAGDLRRLIDAIERKGNEARRLMEIVGALRQLAAPPTPHDTGALVSLLNKIQDVARSVGRGVAIGGSVAALKNPPTIEPIGPLRELVERLGKAVGLLRARAASVEALKELPSPPALEDESALQQIVTVYAGANDSIAREERRVQIMRQLKDPPVPAEVAPLAGLVEKMARATSATKLAAARMLALGPLAEPPTPADPRPLRDVIDRCAEARKRADLRGAALVNTLAEIQIVRDQIDLWVCDNPACPVCGGETDRERLLGTGRVAKGGVHV